LLLHDWPEGLSAGVTRQGSAGNAYARLLVDLLEPKLVACGHMHHAYEEIIEHPSGNQTRVICLGHITQRSDAIAIMRWDGEQFERLDA
jgi:Icc-related predicted phosphoesterase